MKINAVDIAFPGATPLNKLAVAQVAIVATMPPDAGNVPKATASKPGVKSDNILGKDAATIKQMILDREGQPTEGGILLGPEYLQKIVQELQIVRGQIQTFSSQISEYSLTMESLESQSPEKTVYKSVGNLLLEVSDRKKLFDELSQSKLNIENHLKSLIEKEDSLRVKYEELVIAFESQ